MKLGTNKAAHIRSEIMLARHDFYVAFDKQGRKLNARGLVYRCSRHSNRPAYMRTYKKLALTVDPWFTWPEWADWER